MRTGRPKLEYPTVQWEVSIPADVAAEVTLLLTDPVKGVVAYGKRTELVASLLAKWLAEQKLPAERKILASDFPPPKQDGGAVDQRQGAGETKEPGVPLGSGGRGGSLDVSVNTGAGYLNTGGKPPPEPQ